jgi:hypothetical protein
MQFKNENSIALSGIHLCAIIYCENDNCIADNIVWVSEQFEKPVYESVVALAYEIGWEFVGVDNQAKLLCQKCATLYHEEQKSLYSQYKTVELGGLVQTEKQREDAARTNSE